MRHAAGTSAERLRGYGPAHSASLSTCARRKPCRRAAEQGDELAAVPHVWMAPAWQEITSRAAQKSLAVMCPACSRSPEDCWP